MANQRLKTLNVLILDDCDDSRGLLSGVLRGLGVSNIAVATDAAAAFEQLRTDPVDVVFVDWAVSPVDGAAFTRLLCTATDSPAPHVPVIGLAARTKLPHVLKSQDAGVHAFLIKPVSPQSVYFGILSVLICECRSVEGEEFAAPGQPPRDAPLRDSADAGQVLPTANPDRVNGERGRAHRVIAMAEPPNRPNRANLIKAI